jgi:hypothetical protein
MYRLSKILLLVLNVIIWSIVAFELAYIKPCRVDPPQSRLHGPTLSVGADRTISI